MAEKKTYTDDLGANQLPECLRMNPFTIPIGFFKQQEEEISRHIKLENRLKASETNKEAVPENYFNELQNSILARISEVNLKEKVDSEGFEIPDNYFSTMEANIQNRLFEDDLKSKIKDSGFDTPADYFSTLQHSISTQIVEVELKLHVANDGFNVPSAYFETLEDNIKNNVFVDKISNTLSDGSLVVPSGYFENLENRITAKIHSDIPVKEDNTPIITLPKRTNWLQFSAAAAVLLIGIGSYFVINNNTKTPTPSIAHTTTQNLQGISDEELVSYLAQVAEDDVQLVNLSKIMEDKNDEPLDINSKVEDDEIEEYLNYML